MKRGLIISSILLMGVMAFAQNDMKIYMPGISYAVNDSTIAYIGAINTDHTVLAFVKNTSAGSINVKPKYVVTTAVPGGQNSFCWGVQCYAADASQEFVSPSSDAIGANHTDSTFSGHYYDLGTVGTNIVRYVFSNTANANDSAWVQLKYIITPLGVEQLSADALHMSAPYPNPAKSSVAFNYHLNGIQQAVLEVYNTIGQNVQTQSLNSADNKVDLNVSELPSGLYICKLQADGVAPVFQKMMVTH